MGQPPPRVPSTTSPRPSWESRAPTGATWTCPPRTTPIIAQGVNGTQGSIGYFGLAYLAQYRDLVSPVAIENPATGECVEPSPETVENGTYQPLARPVFIYVRRDLLDSQPEVEAFIRFYLQNATSLVPQVGYVALPQTAYQWGLGQVQLRATGSVFTGVAPGTPIDTVLGKLR